MKLLFMIICLLLATNVYADQTKNANGNDVQQETKDANGNYVQQEAPKGVPTWAGANTDNPPRYDEGLQPSYDRTDEPSFGPDRDR